MKSITARDASIIALIARTPSSRVEQAKEELLPTIESSAVKEACECFLGMKIRCELSEDAKELYDTTVSWMKNRRDRVRLPVFPS